MDVKGAAPELRRRSTLGAGDVSVAHDASERAWQCLSVARPQVAVAQHAFNAIALAEGDLVLARCLADEAVSCPPHARVHQTGLSSRVQLVREAAQNA